MNKKGLILGLIGFLVLITIQVLLNVFVGHRKQEFTMITLPIFGAVYFIYIKFIINRYL